MQDATPDKTTENTNVHYTELTTERSSGTTVENLDKLPTIDIKGDEIIIRKGGKLTAEDGSSILGSGTPYQALVTDSKGEPRWEDKTHYNDKHTIEWDGDTADRTSVIALTSNRWYKVSDEIPSYDKFCGNVDYTNYKNTTLFDGVSSGDGWYGRFGVSNSATTYGLMVVVVYKAPATVRYSIYDRIFNETGTYFFKTAGDYLTSITWGSSKQLLDEYIPSTIQRVGSPLYLTDSAGVQWQISVGTDGTLTTAQVATE